MRADKVWNIKKGIEKSWWKQHKSGCSMENPAEDHEIMMIPILLDFLSSLNATREKADN